jgi:peptidyl-prolyl cis-trans isomerase A (cyclophilin A)
LIVRGCFRVLFLAAGAINLTVNQAANPKILIKTDLGDIKVEIYEKQAPITAANFLRYVDAGCFREASFYRVVRMDNQPNNTLKIEVVQGGLEFSAGRKDFSAIEHETTAKTSILHKDGVISMARDNPGSATSEFFICVGDQPERGFEDTGLRLDGDALGQDPFSSHEKRCYLKRPKNSQNLGKFAIIKFH